MEKEAKAAASTTGDQRVWNSLDMTPDAPWPDMTPGSPRTDMTPDAPLPDITPEPPWLDMAQFVFGLDV